MSALIKCILLVPTVLMLQGCFGEDDGIDACAADLEGKLKAPSTLKLVSAYRGDMPPIDHAARIAKLEQSVRDDEARFDGMSEADRFYLAYKRNVYIPEMKAKHDPTVTPSYSILLTYDAENSFGAPLRGHHWCRIAHSKGSDDSTWEAGGVSDEQAKTDKAMMKEVSLPLF